ncbi:MAG: hypothetical protein ABIO70_10830 [Pseudomonadota bacterium]
MPALLALLWLLLAPVARGACAEDPLASLEAHVEAATAAWRAGVSMEAAHAGLLEDLGCLAGSGLSTRDPELFLVLARGALDADDGARALAAARALLVVAGGDPLPADLVPPGGDLAGLLERALVAGPDAVGFRTLFLFQPPSPEQLAALERERLLAEVRANIAMDRRGHRVGALCTTLGATTTALSLSFIAARATEGQNKPVQHAITREAMGKVWAGTAITGGVTTVFGVWLLRQSKR